MDISQCTAYLTDYGPTLGVDHVLQNVISNIPKNKFNMQRCQSGRSCSLGTAVYGNVPRVQIPVSAPIQNSAKPAVFYFAWTGFCKFYLLSKLCLLEPGEPLCTRVLVSFQLPPENCRSLRSLIVLSNNFWIYNI